MLDAASVVDLAPERDGDMQGQDPDHRQSLWVDSASSLIPLEERGRRWHRDDRDLRGVIDNRDAHDQIENWRQEQDHAKQCWHKFWPTQNMRSKYFKVVRNILFK
jgi:hypothetical protein